MPVRNWPALSAKKQPAKQRNGKLKIELPLDEALRAALETKPPPKEKPRKSRHPRG